MGTQQVKLWTTCLQMLGAIIVLPEEPEELAVSSLVMLDELKELEACPKATWKKLVLDMQMPLKLATAFVQLLDRNADTNSTVFNFSSQALCVFLSKAHLEGCASGEAASSKIEKAVRQQLQQSGLLRVLPEVTTDTAEDMTQAAKQAAGAAAAAAVGSSAPAGDAGSSGSGNSSGSSEYPRATVARAEMLLLFVMVLLPFWPDGLHRQQMAASLEPVCHLSLASVYLVSNLLIGQKQPHPDIAFGMQGILHRAVKVSAEIYGARRGCVPFVIDYKALCNHPELLEVINSQQFIPSVAFTTTVLALALTMKERQDMQHVRGGTATSAGSAAKQTQGDGAAAAASSSAAGADSSSSSSSGSGSRQLTPNEVKRAVRQRLTQNPQEAFPGEFNTQAVTSFTDAARLLPKLTRSHRKLFSLLGVDPRVGLWAAAMLLQPSLPFQQGRMPVQEVLQDVTTVYTQTMGLMLNPGPYIPAKKQAELWQQHLKLPKKQLQLERQLALLVPFVLLHGAARLQTANAASLEWIVSAAKMATQAPIWCEMYTQVLPRVVEDPWLQWRMPVQWVDDMLPALLKLGSKVADSLPATAAAAAADRGSPAPASAAAGASNSSAVSAQSQHSKMLMCALESTVATLGQILFRCTESATEWMVDTAQKILDLEARGEPTAPVAVASNSPTPGLLRACLAAAADGFAVVEAFVRAAAAGFSGDHTQDTLAVGVLQFLYGGFKGSMPVVSLCWQADDGKSVRNLYSLSTSCLKLQSTQSALPARVAAAERHATLRICQASITLLQDRHWPAILLQAGDTAAAKQGAAAGWCSPQYDPVSRLPSVVMFGRCCLLWAQEIKASLPGLLAQLAAPHSAGSSSRGVSSSSSSKVGARSLSSLQLQQHSASWVCFELAHQRKPTPASALQMLVDTLDAWVIIHAGVLTAAGCNAAELVQHLQQLLAAQQTAARSTSNVAAAVDDFVRQLLATGKRCCAVPLKTLCNNPVCGVTGGPSELKLVGGGVGLCKGCLGARYCSKACQNQHWKQHKLVCKVLAEHKAAGAATGAAVAKHKK